MTPEAQHLYNALNAWAAQQDAKALTVADDKKALSVNMAALLRETAAFVEKRGASAPVREAAE